MKRCLLVVLALAVSLTSVFAQSVDPEEVVKDVAAHRAAKVKEARDAQKPVDTAAINQECIAIAEKALKEVDLTKIDPAKALAWARVTQLAERHHDTCELAKKYLATNPDPKSRHAAETMMLSACYRLGEGDMLAMMLPTVAPDTKQAAVSLAIVTAGSYVDAIQSKKGAEAALKTLDEVEKKVPYAELTTDQEKNMADNARASLAGARAEILVGLERKDEAVKILDEALKAMNDANGAMAKRLASSKTQYTMIGVMSPPMPVERSHGEFKDLESLKGKVVILDFFAHWCGPCIRSFPDMKEMYNANKSKGLEIIGVTTYYGYYRRENVEKRDMPKDTEFAKMADFMKEHKIDWPVIYTDRSSYAPFGVTGIPHVVLIDRDGKVVKVKVGYSPESFKEFRATVEKLLAK